MPGIFRDRILEGKTAFITGGGIGLRIAERFSEHGARVVLVGRSHERLAAAAAGIRAAQGVVDTAVRRSRSCGTRERSPGRPGASG